MKFKSIIVSCILLLTLAGVLAQEREDEEYQYALIEALKQKNLGNMSEAVKLYRLVIREKPDCSAAHYELGSIYLMTKQYELAVINLESAYNLEPGNKWFTLSYLNSLGMVKDYDTMEGVLNRKIREEPGEVEWLYQLATCYVSQGKLRKSLKELDRIEKEYGFSEKVTLLKATVYESQGEYELALEELEKVMVLFPEALQFRLAAAELAAKSGDIVLSLKFMEEAFRNPYMDFRRKIAVLGLYLSDDSVRDNYKDALEKLLVVAIEEHPDEGDVHLLASDFYIQTRDYKKAYWQLKTYLEDASSRYELYMQAIMLANASSLNDELLLMSGKALGLYPDSTDLVFFRAIGLYESAKNEELVELLEDLDFDSFSSEDYRQQASMLLAEAYNRQELYTRADSLFRELIEANPDNFLVLNNYSYYLAERGEQLLEAEQWSRKAIKANPDNSTFLDTYAWILYKLERFEEAERYILKAIEKGGENDPEVNEHAGDIQLALDSPDLAKSYYRKAIILGGDRAKLEEKVNALEQ